MPGVYKIDQSYIVAFNCCLDSFGVQVGVNGLGSCTGRHGHEITRHYLHVPTSIDVQRDEVQLDCTSRISREVVVFFF